MTQTSAHSTSASFLTTSTTTSATKAMPSMRRTCAQRLRRRAPVG
ncbi:hypothetical protein [Cupriavidus sp. H18C1]